MLMQRLWCGVGLALMAVTCTAGAESGKQDSPNTKINPAAAEVIKVKPVVPPSNGQQGNYQQGQFPPGQGPNNKVPPPAQIPSGVQNQPVIPSPLPDSAGDAANHSDAVRAAAEAQKQIEAVRAGQDGLNLGILDAEDARERGAGLNPDQLGLPSNDPEMDAAAEALRGITEQLGSNRDKQSDTTRGFASVITTDPQSLLDSAGSGQTSQGGTEPGNSSDGWDSKTVNQDGTVTRTRTDGTGRDRTVTRETTTSNQDGTTTTHTTVSRGRSGEVVQFMTVIVSASGTSQTGVESTRQGDGSWENRLFRTGRSSPTAEWRAAGSSHRWRSDTPETDPRSWVRSVDPDSTYGHGSGQVVGPGQKKKDPAMVAARDHGAGPGARPDDQAAGGVAPRIELGDFGDVVNPPPDAPTGGGSGPAHQGFNPNDTYDGPRDPK